MRRLEFPARPSADPDTRSPSQARAHLRQRATVLGLGPVERTLSQRARRLRQGLPVGIAGATARLAAGYRAWRSAERHLQQQAQRHVAYPGWISPTATFQEYLEYCARVGAAAGGTAPASSPSGPRDTPSQTTSMSTVSGAPTRTPEAQRRTRTKTDEGTMATTTSSGCRRLVLVERAGASMASSRTDIGPFSPAPRLGSPEHADGAWTGDETASMVDGPAGEHGERRTDPAVPEDGNGGATP